MQYLFDCLNYFNMSTAGITVLYPLCIFTMKKSMHLILDSSRSILKLRLTRRISYQAQIWASQRDWCGVWFAFLSDICHCVGRPLFGDLTSKIATFLLCCRLELCTYWTDQLDYGIAQQLQSKIGYKNKR